MSSVFFPLLDYYLIVNAFTAAVLFQCLASPYVVCAYQLTLALYCTMTNHFCITVLFEYTWDMD